MKTTHKNPLAALRHHVSGAIARGEAVAVVEQSAFEEITLSNGEAEAMAHRTPAGKWIAFYAYRRDVAAGEFPQSWQWRDGLNPLFVHLVSPLPSKAVASLRARGFCSS